MHPWGRAAGCRDPAAGAAGRHISKTGAMTDHYADGTCRWWHLSRPSPELISALGDDWLPPGGRVLDIGCGLGSEAGYLALAGWQAAGIDLSETAIARAAAGHRDAAFALADARRLPFRQHCFDAALDRGCFHYLPPPDRPVYADELRRVLKPGGKLLLRASLRRAGVRNDMNEAVISAAFAGWHVEHTEHAAVPSDTRMLEVIIARLSAARPTLQPGQQAPAAADTIELILPDAAPQILMPAMTARPGTMRRSLDHAT